jgi:hypothetical protein
MTLEETRDYIRTRLRIAGARDLHLFDEQAVRQISEYAGGIPRVVNIVCDHSLLIGYADQRRLVRSDIVDRAIRYLEEGELPSRQSRRVPWWRSTVPASVAAGTILASTGGILAAMTLTPDSWVAVWQSVVSSMLDFARAARHLVGG